MEKKFKAGDTLESPAMIVVIQKARIDYYETLETNKRTGEKTNQNRTERGLIAFEDYIAIRLLMQGTK
jgi:hypothetical protein